MSTKHSSDGNVHSHYSPYASPYTAFTNYMNVLSDFMTRVEQQFPAEIDNEELNALLLTINNQETEIAQLKREVEMMRNNITKDLTGDFPPIDNVEPQQETPQKPQNEEKPKVRDKKSPTTDDKPQKEPKAKKATKTKTALK